MSVESGQSPQGLSPSDLLVAQGILTYRAATQLGGIISKESSPAHHAATMEFVYGFVFVTLQHVGRALDQHQWPDNELSRVLAVVCRGLLGEAIRRALPNITTPEDFDASLKAYMDAFDSRAKTYVRIPMLPAEGARLGGTLVWELPIEAGRVAGVDVDAATALTLPMTVMAAMVGLKAPAFADMFASALRR
jgi:hypothetical protein